MNKKHHFKLYLPTTQVKIFVNSLIPFKLINGCRTSSATSFTKIDLAAVSCWEESRFRGPRYSGIYCKCFRSWRIKLGTSDILFPTASWDLAYLRVVTRFISHIMQLPSPSYAAQGIWSITECIISNCSIQIFWYMFSCLNQNLFATGRISPQLELFCHCYLLCLL